MTSRTLTGPAALFEVLHHLDGEHSLLEIAERCNTELSTVKAIVDQLEEIGLVTLDA